MLIKYIKSVLWTVAKRLSYIQDARCLKVKPRERAFKQLKSPVLNVLTVGILRRISGQCHHHAAGLSGSDICHLVIEKQHSVYRTSGTEQLHCSNSGGTLCVAIAVPQTDSIAPASTVLPSIAVSRTDSIALAGTVLPYHRLTASFWPVQCCPLY